MVMGMIPGIPICFGVNLSSNRYPSSHQGNFTVSLNPAVKSPLACELASRRASMLFQSPVQVRD